MNKKQALSPTQAMKMIERLDVECEHEGFSQQTAEDLRAIIRDVEDWGLREVLPTIVEACQTPKQYLTLPEARLIITRCLSIHAKETPDRFLTPKEAAAILRVGENKVLSWIRSGRLSAVNVNDPGGRPGYRIHPEALTQLGTAKPSSGDRPRARHGKAKPPGDYFDGNSQP